MPLTNTKKNEIAKIVTEGFWDANSSEILEITQDHVDSFVIPLMTEIEDMVNILIFKKVTDMMDSEKRGVEDPLW